MNWGDTDGVHLIDRDTGHAVCDVRAQGSATHKAVEVTCSLCDQVRVARAEGHSGGYNIDLALRGGPEEPTVGERIPFLRDDGRAMLPEIVKAEPHPTEPDVTNVTVYSRDPLFTVEPTPEPT